MAQKSVRSKRKLYFKECNVLELFFLVYFSTFNLYWIDKTYSYLNVEQGVFLGLTMNSFVGVLIIGYIITRMMGIKKFEVKNDRGILNG